MKSSAEADFPDMSLERRRNMPALLYGEMRTRARHSDAFTPMNFAADRLDDRIDSTTYHAYPPFCSPMGHSSVSFEHAQGSVVNCVRCATRTGLLSTGVPGLSANQRMVARCRRTRPCRLSIPRPARLANETVPVPFGRSRTRGVGQAQRLACLGGSPRQACRGMSVTIFIPAPTIGKFMLALAGNLSFQIAGGAPVVARQVPGKS